MRPRFLVLPVLVACTAAAAQASSQMGPQPAPDGRQLLQEPEQATGRKNQKIERIHLEDGGARIDELRYGGQTQSITVQPKANVPEYGIQSTDLARSRPADSREGLGNATGQRFWNVFKF